MEPEIVGSDYQEFMRRVMKSSDPSKYSYGDITYPMGVEDGTHKAWGISLNKAMKSLRSRVLRALEKLAKNKKLTAAELALIERHITYVEQAAYARDINSTVKALMPLAIRVIPQR